MLVGGIDPGREGFLCVLNDKNEPIFYKLPYENGELNIPIFEAAIQLLDVVFVEMPIGGAFANKNTRDRDFGELRGLIRRVSAFITIMPMVWKKYFGLDGDKKKSIALAQKLYPDADLKYYTPGGKPTDKFDDNKAEALLIAHFGKSNAMLQSNNSSL